MPAAAAAKIGREFAANAEESGGRSMIIMGAGTNHWFHSDTIYRAFLTLTTLTGCQGVNGGGWAHYVGQEKCRPVRPAGRRWRRLDWSRPPRQMIQTAYWYLHTDQFRYDRTGVEGLAAADRAPGVFAGKTAADVIAAVGPDGLDAVAPHVRPQPARPVRRRRRQRAGCPARLRGRSELQAGRAAVRLRGPGRARRTSRGC